MTSEATETKTSEETAINCPATVLVQNVIQLLLLLFLLFSVGKFTESTTALLIYSVKSQCFISLYH